VRVILRKATKVLGKLRPVNTVMVVTLEKANELGTSAEEYKGVFPPKKKHKMNLSQLKK
jgi:small nuclear ribonucleoprotein (snRNP)-like protein